jgi:hypothetical protein
VAGSCCPAPTSGPSISPKTSCYSLNERSLEGSVSELHPSASYGTTFEKDDINPGDQLGFSVGALLAASPETSLHIILNQTFVNELEVEDRALADPIW